MPSVPPPARCARHDLAPGPDGRCVLCRREQAGSAAIEIAPEPARFPGWLLGVGAAMLLAAGGVAYGLRPRAPARQPVAAVAPPAQPAAKLPKPEPQQPEPQLPAAEQPPEPTAEEQLAEVERARAEREHEIAEAQRAEVRKRMEEAEAKRKLAEEASDKKRHALVTRELANAALASARRSVSITMYSTSWCSACKQARAYMQEQAIEFTDLDVEHDAAARARARALNPRGSVPTISIDGDVMIGFSARSLESRIDSAARRRKGS